MLCQTGSCRSLQVDVFDTLTDTQSVLEVVTAAFHNCGLWTSVGWSLKKWLQKNRKINAI